MEKAHFPQYIWPKIKRTDNYSQVILSLTFQFNLDKTLSFQIKVKECDKSQIIRENKVKYVHLEKRILAEYLNDHPFFVKLCSTFQDEASLCNILNSLDMFCLKFNFFYFKTFVYLFVQTEICYPT